MGNGKEADPDRGYGTDASAAAIAVVVVLASSGGCASARQNDSVRGDTALVRGDTTRGGGVPVVDDRGDVRYVVGP